MKWPAGMLLLAFIAAGCENAHRIPREYHPMAAANDPLRMQRDREMNSRWQNRPLSELLGTLGTPQTVLTIPGGGNPPGFAVIYGIDARSGCIDAFAVNIESNPQVRMYVCR